MVFRASAVARASWFRALGIAVAAPTLLADQPIRAQPTIEIAGVIDVLSVIDGGTRREPRVLTRTDATIAWDDDFLDIPGARGFVDLMLITGGGFSDRFVGDAQVVSNIDAPTALRPIELWIELPLAPALRAKAGYIDLNTEFDVQEVGASFINSSFGVGPAFSQTGPNGPSIFPVTAAGAVLAWEREGLALRAGVFDALAGDPDDSDRFLPGAIGTSGLLGVAEVDVAVGQNGFFRLGGWHYTEESDLLDQTGEAKNYGGYAHVEHVLFADQSDSLAGWARAGLARDKLNTIGTYVGGGVRWGDDDRHIGVGIAHAHLGDAAFAQGYAHSAETVYELTAFHRINDRIAVQPDLQYVKNPAWSDTPDALVAGLRLHWVVGLLP